MHRPASRLLELRTLFLLTVLHLPLVSWAQGAASVQNPNITASNSRRIRRSF